MACLAADLLVVADLLVAADLLACGALQDFTAALSFPAALLASHLGSSQLPSSILLAGAHESNKPTSEQHKTTNGRAEAERPAGGLRTES